MAGLNLVIQASIAKLPNLIHRRYFQNFQKYLPVGIFPNFGMHRLAFEADFSVVVVIGVLYDCCQLFVGNGHATLVHDCLQLGRRYEAVPILVIGLWKRQKSKAVKAFKCVLF